MAGPGILLLTRRVVEPEAGEGEVLVQFSEVLVAGIGVAVETKKAARLTGRRV